MTSIKLFLVIMAVTSIFTVFTVAHARVDRDSSYVLHNLSGQGVYRHLQSLDQIAKAYGNNRAAGSAGHEASANYVAQKLLSVGYKVQLIPFDFKKFKKTEPAALDLIGNSEDAFVDEKDIKVMTYSPSGDIEAPITAVDVAEATSGCEESDFVDFTRGNLALIRRGTCPFTVKALNAQKAGASGVLIFNQGDGEGRMPVFVGTLGEDSGVTIPVLATSYQVGQSILAVQYVSARLHVATSVEVKLSYNVIAENSEGDPESVVAIGAHLDSVDEGPGINDNGTGSAGILEVALKMSKVQTKNRLRYAWWGAEELGLIGSRKYVTSLSEIEKSKIKAYLNFDMIASPNYIIGVYDGDGSSFPPAGPKGSEVIENLFQMIFGLYGTSSVSVPMNGRSDYASFAEAGIAVGGTFTGAEGTKSEEESKLFGGVAGKPYDACYHQLCDSIENISLQALDANVIAIGFMAVRFGHSLNDLREKISPLTLAENHPASLQHLHSAVATSCADFSWY